MRDVERCTSSCRCQTPDASNGFLYLNAFCRYRDSHRPLADYGCPRDFRTVSAQEYHENYLREKGLRP